MSDIIEILRQHQLKKIAKIISFTEVLDRDIDNKVQHAKAILGGESYHSDRTPLTLLNHHYYDMLKTYKGKFISLAPVDMNKSSLALWNRVEDAREQANCDAERYIKAQFVWFDKNFGVAPTPWQLATDSAVERAVAFAGSTKGKVLGNERKAPVTKADTFRESEKLLQQLMTAQSCTRAEFYKNFVLTGLYTFPKEFLKADPTYKKLVSK